MTKTEALEAINRLICCCNEALNDEWDRSDDGFIAMRDELADLEEYVKSVRPESPQTT